jgi:hypothetical protein
MQTTNKTGQGDGGDMKHPQHEEWMAFLYGEITGEEKVGLAAHLGGCADCRKEVAAWQGAMNALGEWKIATSRETSGIPRAALRWGIAAALMLGMGFGLGRLVSSGSAERTAMRAAIQSEVRAELAAEFKPEQDRRLAEIKRAIEQVRAEDHRLLLTAMNKVEADRHADFAFLRRELETVALLTQDSFQRAQRQIVTLAGFSQADGKLEQRP